MIRVIVIGLGLSTLAGCGGSATNPELASAYEVLKTGLEAWKQGGSPAALEAGASPLQFQDRDWQSGARLLEYRIVKVGGEEDDATVCAVSLKLQLRGKTVERQVSYRVTLTPKRTVSRYPKG